MIQIIESSEIISYIIMRDETQKQTITVKHRVIRHYANWLESQRYDLRVECDMNSIDNFRNLFSQYVRIQNNDLYILDAPALRPKIKRYMPSSAITKILNATSI